MIVDHNTLVKWIPKNSVLLRRILYAWILITIINIIFIGLIPWLLGFTNEFFIPVWKLNNFEEILPFYLFPFVFLFIVWYFFYYIFKLNISVHDTHIYLSDRGKEVHGKTEEIFYTESFCFLKGVVVVLHLGNPRKMNGINGSLFSNNEYDSYIQPLLSNANIIPKWRMEILLWRNRNPTRMSLLLILLSFVLMKLTT